MTSEPRQVALGDAVADPLASASSAPSDDVGRRLEQLLQQDPAAAAWLYDTFADGLYRRLRGRYAYLEPDDLLQDAFLFYFQNGAKVLRDFLDRVPPAERSERRLGRHLWDLACGLAANRRRASKVRSGTSGFDEGQEDRLEDPASSIETRTADRDTLARLDRCLHQRGQRVALYYRFRFWDGYSPREISALTGWSMKATYKLRQALAHGLAACAEKLGLEWDDGPESTQ